MRYPASEKLETIRLVEQSHLPIKQTLDKLGIPSTTLYRWYDRYPIGRVRKSDILKSMVWSIFLDKSSNQVGAVAVPSVAAARECRPGVIRPMRCNTNAVARCGNSR